MFKSLISTAGAVAVAAATLLLSADDSWARSRPGGGGGGYRGGYSGGYRGGNYGGYRGGYYGGYRGGYYGGYGWGYPGYYGGYYSPRIYSDGYYGSVDVPSYYTVPSAPVYSEPSESVMPAAEESEAVVEQVAKIDVIVPSSTAAVLIDGKATAQKGTMRKFETPDLASGRSFSSEFTVRWTENGQQREQSRTVSYRAGQHLTVDFTRSQSEKIPAPQQ
jgi:uncharacterized protein (TIGR03000 family)